MKMFPAESTVTPCGSFSRHETIDVPFEQSPDAPVSEPATVYASPAVIAIPHWVPELDGTSMIRFPSASAMYRFPPEYDTEPGLFSAASVAGPPIPVSDAHPSTVYTYPGSTDLPADSHVSQLSVHP